MAVFAYAEASFMDGTYLPRGAYRQAFQVLTKVKQLILNEIQNKMMFRKYGSRGAYRA